MNKQSQTVGQWVVLKEDGSNEPKEDGVYVVKMHTGSMSPKIVLTYSTFTKYPNGRSRWTGAFDWNYVTEYLSKQTAILLSVEEWERVQKCLEDADKMADAFVKTRGWDANKENIYISFKQTLKSLNQ